MRHTLVSLLEKNVFFQEQNGVCMCFSSPLISYSKMKLVMMLFIVSYSTTSETIENMYKNFIRVHKQSGQLTLQSSFDPNRISCMFSLMNIFERSPNGDIYMSFKKIITKNKIYRRNHYIVIHVYSF